MKKSTDSEKYVFPSAEVGNDHKMSLYSFKSGVYIINLQKGFFFISRSFCDTHLTWGAQLLDIFFADNSVEMFAYFLQDLGIYFKNDFQDHLEARFIL